MQVDVNQGMYWCPEGDLNPHGILFPADFRFLGGFADGCMEVDLLALIAGALVAGLTEYILIL